MQVRHVIYAWHGRASSRGDRAACTMSMNEVSAAAGGGGASEDRQVIAEGKETKHFAIACGRLLLVSDSKPAPGDGCSRMRTYALAVCGRLTESAQRAGDPLPEAAARNGANSAVGMRMWAVVDFGSGSASSSTLTASSSSSGSNSTGAPVSSRILT